jgi:putative transposase
MGRNRIKAEKKGHPPVPTTINEVWTMDFVSDSLQVGRPIRTLNVLDAFTRQCHRIEVDTSLAGYRARRVLETLIQRHGKPQRLQIDNGPEFRCKAVDEWAKKEGVRLYFIDPGKPNQNNRIESFNSRFRAECLNQECFLSLAEVRRTIEAWRVKYNTTRPHSSLKYLPPNTSAEQYLQSLQVGDADQKEAILQEADDGPRGTSFLPACT